MSETISVHNMFSPGLSLKFSCIELSDKDLPVHKSCGEVYLVEEDTIECVSVAYLKFIINFLIKSLHFSHLQFMQQVRTLQ